MRNVQHLSDTSGRGPSGTLIAGFEDFMFSDMGDGYSIMEDFVGFGLSTAVGSNVGRYAGRSGVWKSYEDTSSSTAGLNYVGGVRRLVCDATNNHQVALESGDGATTGSFEMLTSANKGTMLAFEARIRLHTAITVTSDFFIGLGQPGLAVTTGVFTADSFQTAIDYIGLGWNNAGKSVLVGRYQLGSNGAETTTTLTGQAGATLVADTWVKVGFLFIPKPLPAQGNAGVAFGNLTYFINGAAIPGPATFLTDANAPLSRFLTPIISAKTGNSQGGAVNVDIDWLYCLQHPVAGQ